MKPPNFGNLSRDTDGTLGFEVGIGREIGALKEWHPTIAQIRDTVLAHRVTSVRLSNVPTTELAYWPTNDEVNTASDMAAEAVLAGRVIDFGHLPNEVLKEGGRRGGPLYSKGAIGLPFTSPWMMIHTWEHGVSIYIVNPLQRDKPAGGDFEATELNGLNISGNPMLVIGDRVLLTPDPADKDHRYVALAMPSPVRYAPQTRAWLTSLGHTDQASEPEKAAAATVLDPVMTGLLLLATNGVVRETIRAPDKLNRARVKNRKPPIPPYDRVQSELYVTAILARHQPRDPSEPRGGTHASPVPHVRRGHLRTYASGTQTFIRDTLVAVTQEARANFQRTRSHYTVTNKGDPL